MLEIKLPITKELKFKVLGRITVEHKYNQQIYFDNLLRLKTTYFEKLQNRLQQRKVITNKKLFSHSNHL